MNISNLGHPRGLIQVGEEKGGRGIYYAHWRLDKCSVMIRDFPSLAKKKKSSNLTCGTCIWGGIGPRGFSTWGGCIIGL